MNVLFSDLDETLLFSKEKLKSNPKLVLEYIQASPFRYMTSKSVTLLKTLCDNNKMYNFAFVPITTRTPKQYNRTYISFIFKPRYALTLNGCILLDNDKIDKDWYIESKELAAPALDELLKAQELIEDIRILEDMIAFLCCKDSQEATEIQKTLKSTLNTNLVDVVLSGRKLYILPIGLDKGSAIERFKKHFRPQRTYAAGDSDLDKAMFVHVNKSFHPATIKLASGEVFSDKWLSLLNEDLERRIFN